VAPFTDTDPFEQLPAASEVPPMVPVVPLKVIAQVGQVRLGVAPPEETNGALAVTPVTVPLVV